MMNKPRKKKSYAEKVRSKEQQFIQLIHEIMQLRKKSHNGDLSVRNKIRHKLFLTGLILDDLNGGINYEVYKSSLEYLRYIKKQVY